MIKCFIYILLTVLFILPADSQVKDKLSEMRDECRLVRGHAYTLQQMIEEDKYNEYVAREHFRRIDTNLKALEFTLREIETLLTSSQKVRVATEIDRLFQLCNETKPMVESLQEELDSEESNIQRIRILASRINRNLRTAMEVVDAVINKL